MNENETSLTPYMIILTAILAFAKLLGASIGWVWVFAPLWIPYAVVFGFVGAILVLVFGFTFICMVLGLVIAFFEHFFHDG